MDEFLIISLPNTNIICSEVVRQFAAFGSAMLEANFVPYGLVYFEAFLSNLHAKSH